MKKRNAMLPLLVLSLMAWFVLVAAAAPAPDPERAAPESVASCDTSTGTNLLYNPSFEGQYSAYIPPGGHPDCPYGICTTAQMAAGWTPYWRSHDPNEPDPTIIRMPEYKPATLDVPGPTRVRPGGERAQQYFTFWSTHEAGVYQQVTVTPGVEYCFSVWAHTWSSTNDDPWTSDSNYPLRQRLGIDPTGGTNWQSPSVLWGPMFEQYNVYAQFSHSAVAQATKMTVFLYSRPDWAAKHNDVYWDDAALVALSNEPASLSVTPHQLLVLTAASAPSSSQQTLEISLTGPASLMWQAALDTSGGLTPTLYPTSGSLGDDLTVTVDSAAYGLGEYTATITLSTNLPATGSPVEIPVKLVVVPKIETWHVPTFWQD